MHTTGKCLEDSTHTTKDGSISAATQHEDFHSSRMHTIESYTCVNVWALDCRSERQRSTHAKSDDPHVVTPLRLQPQGRMIHILQGPWPVQTTKLVLRFRRFVADLRKNAEFASCRFHFPILFPSPHQVKFSHLAFVEIRDHDLASSGCTNICCSFHDLQWHPHPHEEKQKSQPQDIGPYNGHTRACM